MQLLCKPEAKLSHSHVKQGLPSSVYYWSLTQILTLESLFAGTPLNPPDCFIGKTLLKVGEASSGFGRGLKLVVCIGRPLKVFIISRHNNHMVLSKSFIINRSR